MNVEVTIKREDKMHGKRYEISPEEITYKFGNIFSTDSMLYFFEKMKSMIGFSYAPKIVFEKPDTESPEFFKNIIEKRGGKLTFYEDLNSDCAIVKKEDLVKFIDKISYRPDEEKIVDSGRCKCKKDIYKSNFKYGEFYEFAKISGDRKRIRFRVSYTNDYYETEFETFSSQEFNKNFTLKQ